MVCGLQVYLNNKTALSRRSTSPAKTLNFLNIQLARKVAGRSVHSAHSSSAAVFGLLVVGLFGQTSAAHAQTLSSTSPVQVIAKNSGKCLDVRGDSTDAGANIQQWSCTGDTNQQWLFIAAGDGSYEVQSVNSGMSLNVYGNSSSNGAPIIQWPYSGTPNENWRLQPTGNGYYTLVVESTGKCLDVTGGPPATSDGIGIQQWHCWGGDNQAWQLVSDHSVTLTWDASTSSNVTGYYVYRGTTSGGPYTKLSSLLSGNSYVDGTVAAGQVYYYVSTAADASGDESAYSNEAQATIPSP